MSAITPLRLILRASKGIECSRDLRSDGLYDFHSDEAEQPQAASTRHSQFEAAMSEVLWEEMGIGRLEGVTKKTVATALRQLFNNAKSLEKAGNDSSGLYAGKCCTASTVRRFIFGRQQKKLNHRILKV